MGSLRPGRMSWELRGQAPRTRARRWRSWSRRHGLRGLVVLGDDVTDLDMFRAARRGRARGELNAAVLAVAGGDEVPTVGGRRRVVLPDPGGPLAALA